MRDYQKELADSLDKSDQIAKLEAKVEELQRQLAERESVIEKLAKAGQALVDRWETPLWKNVPHTAIYIGALRDVIHTPADHTALDEAIKQAKVEVLEEAEKRIDIDYACECGVPCDCFGAYSVKGLMRRIANEIRSK